jgi:hypothetical protein
VRSYLHFTITAVSRALAFATSFDVTGWFIIPTAFAFVPWSGQLYLVQLEAYSNQ